MNEDAARPEDSVSSDVNPLVHIISYYIVIQLEMKLVNVPC